MRIQGRLSYVLAASAGLAICVSLSDRAAGSEEEYGRLLREWARRSKNPRKVRKLMDDAKKKRAKEKAERRKQASKLTLQMVKEAFEKGKKAYEEKRYSEAYLYLQDVAQSRHSGAASMVDQAKTWLAEIEGQARARVEQARIMLLQQRPVDAAVTLQYVVANFPYCAAAAEARMHLRILKSSPSVAAAVRFAEGKTQEEAGNYVEAYRIYEEVAQRWPYELGAEEARRAMRDLREDEEKFELIRAAKDEEVEVQCRKRLLKAQNFLANDMPRLARPELDWIAKNAPESSASSQAEQLMFQIEAMSSVDADTDTDAEGVAEP